jgi:hypothetical protein
LVAPLLIKLVDWGLAVSSQASEPKLVVIANLF